MARLLGLKQVPVFQETGDAKVTTEYGPDIPDYPTPGKTGDHWGLDIVRCSDGKASETATIVAIASGIIYAQRKYMKKGDKSPSGGNCVYILHDDGHTITKYLHLKEDSVPDWVKDNVRVEEGQVIGYMGNTGYSFGAHLHFQVEWLEETPKKITPSIKGTPVDPEPYLTGEKIIGKEKLYWVKVGAFQAEADAQDIKEALQTLGTDSVIEEEWKDTTKLV